MSAETDGNSPDPRAGGGVGRDGGETVVVRVIGDHGPILGCDGREYRLRDGDVLSLPAANADVLLAHDAAERVRTTADGDATLGGWSA